MSDDKLTKDELLKKLEEAEKAKKQLEKTLKVQEGQLAKKGTTGAKVIPGEHTQDGKTFQFKPGHVRFRPTKQMESKLSAKEASEMVDRFGLIIAEKAIKHKGLMNFLVKSGSGLIEEVK